MSRCCEICCLEAVEKLRGLYREEMRCQVVHDSIHERAGWTEEYLLRDGWGVCGYGSVAVGGPWKEKRTYYEFYLLPEQRGRAFEFFELLLEVAGPRFFEVQTNDLLSTTMALAYGREVGTESIIFQDQIQSELAPNGERLRRLTEGGELRVAMEERQGGAVWVLEFEGSVAGKGGILFHYNRPYGDIYMEVAEPFRRRGFGSYLVQELKRECYALGAVPAARCNAMNTVSRRTLQRAGFAPVAHIMNGEIARH